LIDVVASMHNRTFLQRFLSIALRFGLNSSTECMNNRRSVLGFILTRSILSPNGVATYLGGKAVFQTPSQ
jgi:hypothetical protein